MPSMTFERAIRLADQWSQGHVCSLREGEAKEYHRLSGVALRRMRTRKGKCQFPDGLVIRPDGVNELDPCVYEDIEKYANVTVTVSRCKICGHIEISWTRQPDTEELEIE